jgi:hypothetical protein
MASENSNYSDKHQQAANPASQWECCDKIKPENKLKCSNKVQFVCFFF